MKLLSKKDILKVIEKKFNDVNDEDLLPILSIKRVLDEYADEYFINIDGDFVLSVSNQKIREEL